MNKWLFLSLVGVAAASEVVADILFKKWAIGGKTWIIIIGMLVYAAATGAWAYALKYEQLSKAIVAFTIVNLVAAIVAGIIFFDEQLTAIQWVGVALGVVSVFLLEL
jgi:multidrug transporter EmrE-like cation transporter